MKITPVGTAEIAPQIVPFPVYAVAPSARRCSHVGADNRPGSADPVSGRSNAVYGFDASDEGTRTDSVAHPTFQERFGGLPQVQFGIELPPQTLDIEQGFCSSISCGCTSMLKRRAVWNSVSRKTPKEISLSGRSKIGSDTVRMADSNSSIRVSAGTSRIRYAVPPPAGNRDGKTPENFPPGIVGRWDLRYR